MTLRRTTSADGLPVRRKPGWNGFPSPYSRDGVREPDQQLSVGATSSHRRQLRQREQRVLRALVDSLTAIVRAPARAGSPSFVTPGWTGGANRDRRTVAAVKSASSHH